MKDLEFEISAYGRELDDFERGWIEGVSLYAWWKDGTAWVGSTGSTLKQAIARFLAERSPGASLDSRDQEAAR